ncbi:MAG: TolB family protein [Deltaproteobacteria bacterium]|nr:TolB family protein [Deltaproteobacteria bacterium]
MKICGTLPGGSQRILLQSAARPALFLAALVICFFAGHQRRAAADTIPFPALPSNFDNEFRFHNQYDLRGQVLFTAKIGKFERILMLDLNEKRISKIIDGPGNNFFASWSPDGETIAFVSDRDGNKEIYTAAADGSNQKRVTNTKAAEDHPSWNPDGSAIYFLSQSGKIGNIYAYDLKEGKTRQITRFSGRNSTPKLSPDGKRLAYTTNRFWPGWDICVMDMHSGSESCPLSGKTTYCRPAWSSDGKMLAYSNGLADIDGKVVTIGSGETATVAQTGGDDYDLTWSADDKVLLFASDASKSDIYNLYVTKAAVDPEKGPAAVPVLLSKHSLRYPDWRQAAK